MAESLYDQGGGSYVCHNCYESSHAAALRPDVSAATMDSTKRPKAKSRQSRSIFILGISVAALTSVVGLLVICILGFQSGKNSNLTPPSDHPTSPSPSGIQNSVNAKEEKKKIEKSIIDVENAIAGMNQSIQENDQNIEKYQEQIASWRAKQARGMKTADDVGIGEAIDLGNIGRAFDSIDKRIKSLEESIAHERKQIDMTRWKMERMNNDLTSLRKQLIDLQ